jgi:methionyl-tRNA formyltransferase
MGVTTFLIEEGVDTGPILKVHPVGPQPCDRDFDALRARLEPLVCDYIVEAVSGFLAGSLVPEEQAPEDGRQFFVLHPELKRRADEALIAL